MERIDSQDQRKVYLSLEASMKELQSTTQQLFDNSNRQSEESKRIASNISAANIDRDHSQF
jgi:hypothetical protein